MTGKFSVLIFFIFIFSQTVFAQQIERSAPKIGLVLSGGGAKGLAHVGVLKVLEREGIHVDYITGTSMGALVGGLYAIGYTADELEKIILSQNWNDLLTDRIERTDRTIDSRNNLERYILSFPLKGKEITLPRGVVSGQKVSELLTELTLSVHQETDFSKFPIPFKCIATDIETGMPVVLDKGFLPDALRASMSIPTVYTPVEIEGKLLIDGGLTRNLPAEDLKKMGADIIIGVDVNNMLMSKDDLKDFTLISEQTLTISMMETNKKQRNLCDIIIDPDMNGLNTGSFNKIKKIILSGETAAEKNIDAIKMLVSGNAAKKPVISEEAEKEFIIDEIDTTGQKNISREFILRKLSLKLSDKTDHRQIRNGVARLYGTGYFERVTYQIIDINGKTVLKIRVVERGTDFINVGLHYDSDQNALLLVNLTKKNLISQNSTLTLDAHLGENMKLSGTFLFPVNFLHYLAIETGVSYHNFPVYIYLDDEKIIDYDAYIYNANLNFQTFTFNNFILGFGTEVEKLDLTVNITTAENFDADTSLYYWNDYAFFKYDSLDRINFPKRGLYFYSESKYIFDFTPEKQNLSKNDDAVRIYGLLNAAVPLHRNISWLIDFTAGAVFGDNIPLNYLFYFGGLNNFDDRVFKFAGMTYMQVYGNYCQMVNTGLQFQFYDIFYLTPAVETLKIQNYASSYDINPIDDVILGFSLKAGVLTPLGPIEGQVSAGKDFEEPIFSIFMGYSF